MENGASESLKRIKSLNGKRDGHSIPPAGLGARGSPYPCL